MNGNDNIVANALIGSLRILATAMLKIIAEIEAIKKQRK